MVNGFKVLISSDACMTPIIVFAILKLLLPLHKSDNNLKICLYWMIYITFTVILTTVLYAAFLIFACYYELVKYFAKRKYGKNYVETLNGPDAVWTDESPNAKSIIHLMVLLGDDKNPENTPEQLMEFCGNEENHKNLLELHPRFASVRAEFMGYWHYVKLDQINFKEVITYLDEYTTFEEFKEVINVQTNRGLPFNDTFLWQFCIGRTKVQFDDGKFYFPMLIRLHHSSSDGIALMALMLSSYAKDGVKIMREFCDIYTKRFNQHDRIKNIRKIPSYLAHNLLKHHEPDNALHRDLTEDKMVTYTAESDEHLVDKIRDIKRRMTGTSYTDIILSAISASLTEYFYKYRNEYPPPDKVLCGCIYYMKSLQFDDIFTQTKSGQLAVKLGNKFTAGYIPLPIDPKNLEEPIELISKVGEFTKYQKESLDLLFGSWLMNIITTLIPNALNRHAKKLLDSTVSFTNVPGINTVYLKNGNYISKFFLWTSHWKRAGTAFSFAMFNNKIHMSLFVDKIYTSNEKDIELIAKNVFKYVDFFHKRICN